MARSFGLALGLGVVVGAFALALAGCGGDDEGGASGGGSGGATGGTGGVGGTGTGGTGTGGTGTGGTGTGGTGTGGTGTGGTGTGGTGTGGTGTGGTGTGGTGGTTAGSSCADAIDYLTNADPSTGLVSGAIDPAGDADYYKFELEEGWYILSTEANPDDVQGGIDTVLTMYSEDGATRIATMDDSYPRFSVDSELVYHSPGTQTVCVKVEEWSTWAGEAPLGGGTFIYGLGLFVPDDTVEINNTDTEPNDDAATAQTETFAASTSGASTFGILYGTLDSAADVDVYKYTMPTGTLSASIYFTPSGPGDALVNGNGSTLDLGDVQISNAAGVIASLDVSKGSDSMTVPLTAGEELFVWVNRSGSTAGANDFYRLWHMNSDTDTAPEAETTAGTNDTAATAEALTLEAGSDPTTVSGFLLGYITDPTDVDYFSFTAAAGDIVAVACGAIRSGSGLTTPKFSMYDSADTLIQEEVETDAADVLWTDSPYGTASMAGVTITTAGTYYMAVSAGGQNANVSSNFYRCGIHVETP